MKSVIGPAVYNAFLKEYGAKLNLTTKSQLIKKLDKAGVSYSPAAGIDELLEIHRQEFGKDFISYSRQSTSLQYVVANELNRLAPWSPFKLVVDFYCSEDSFHFLQNPKVKQLNWLNVKECVLEQAIRFMHGDEYRYEYEGRPIISYFKLTEPLDLLEENSPFFIWLHNESLFIKDAIPEPDCDFRYF